MKVYQIIIYGEEGQTFPHNIYWKKDKAEEFVQELLKDSDYQYCSITVQEKEIRE